MSEDKVVKEALDGLAQVAELEAEKKEVQKDKLYVDKHRYKAQADNIKKNQQELQSMETANFSEMNSNAIDVIRKENMEYIKGARKARTFLIEDFNGKIPFSKGNFLLFGAKSKDGKSTLVANIAYSTIMSKDAVTGKMGRALVITNEEAPANVYNRVSCIARGWNFCADQKDFTDEQVKYLDESLPLWSKKLTVINDKFKDQNGITHRGVSTSIEGIKSIFDSIIENNTHYDVIIIDYYQKVGNSKNNAQKNMYEVQRDLCYMLDDYKDLLPCPIVLMCQLMPVSSKADDFQSRIRGSRDVYFTATAIIEVVPDRGNLLTKFTIHGNRWNGSSIGDVIRAGYDNGKFVKYDGNDEFIKKVATIKQNRQNKSIGLPDVFGDTKKDEKDGKPS